jgi:hypothetical protein
MWHQGRPELQRLGLLPYRGITIETNLTTGYEAAVVATQNTATYQSAGHQVSAVV